MKRCTSVLFLLFCWLAQSALAATTTVRTTEELLSALAVAGDGDVLYVEGDVALSGVALASPAHVTLASSPAARAVLRSCTVQNASIDFRDIDLTDLTVYGESEIALLGRSSAAGTAGRSAITFNGSGMLLVEPGCQVQGGTQAAAIAIAHQGGAFYAGLEGQVRGGDGDSGGAGIVVNPLGEGGTLLVDGSIRGGSGAYVGGNALDLYDLRGNAFVSVTGSVSGGNGSVGGDGMQIVSVADRSWVGVTGDIVGGNGQTFGGNAITLMNASGSSSVSLSGSLTGGDAHTDLGEPGHSLLVADNRSLSHALIGDCLLEDGERVQPQETHILPEITSSVTLIAAIDVTPPPPELPPFLEEVALIDTEMSSDTSEHLPDDAEPGKLFPVDDPEDIQPEGNDADEDIVNDDGDHEPESDEALPTADDANAHESEWTDEALDGDPAPIEKPENALSEADEAQENTEK